MGSHGCFPPLPSIRMTDEMDLSSISLDDSRTLSTQGMELVARLFSDGRQGDSSYLLKREEIIFDLLRALSICARFFYCRQLLKKFGIMDYFLSMLRHNCSRMNKFFSDVLIPRLQSSNSVREMRNSLTVIRHY